MQNSTKDFIRKWGTHVINDEYLHPIIKHKYNVAFIIKNCSKQLLSILEP